MNSQNQVPQNDRHCTVAHSSVLLTGADGFIGGRVARLLRNMGTRVASLGLDSWPLKGNVDIENHTISDVHDIAATKHIIQTVRPQWIIHLAGTTQGDANVLYNINTLWGLALLQAAALLESPPGVLLIGSAAEYGPQRYVADSDYGRLIDEDTPCKPQSVYGISKLAQTLHGLAASHRQPVIVARLFNAIGVDMPPALALGHFLKQIKAMPPEGGTLRTGPLHAVRDFVAVEDIANILVGLTCHPKAIGRIVNVCTGIGTPMEVLVRKLMEAAPVPVKLEAAPPPADADDVAIGSCRTLRELGIAIPSCPVNTVIASAFKPIT